MKAFFLTRILMIAVCPLLFGVVNSRAGEVEGLQVVAWQGGIAEVEESTPTVSNAIQNTTDIPEKTVSPWGLEIFSIAILGSVLLFLGSVLRGQLRPRAGDKVLMCKAGKRISRLQPGSVSGLLASIYPIVAKAALSLVQKS